MGLPRLGTKVNIIGTLCFRDKTLSIDPRTIRRRKSTDSTPKPRDVSTPPANPSRVHRLRRNRIEREFFESVLRTTATKREAKGFLSRFKREGNSVTKASPKGALDTQGDHQLKPQTSSSRVNLGALYSLNKAVQNSPVFTHSNLPDVVPTESAAPLHVALVKLRAPQDLSDETLGGIVTTLDQLARLGVLSVLVVDIESTEQLEDNGATFENWRSAVYEQSTRIVESIETNSKCGGRLIDQSLGISDSRSDIPHNIHINGKVDVQIRNLLITPLRYGMIPVVPPIAYSVDSRMHQVNADDVMLALTREFAGITAHQSPSRDDKTSSKTSISLDRIIMLDPLGGIPDNRRRHDSYIFINLEQEYEVIHNALLNSAQQSLGSVGVNPGPAASPNNSTMKPSPDNLYFQRYLQTLECIQRCLTLLPPSSSALLTTPAEVSGSALRSSSDIPTTGVRTRPKKNPLIHNILTDKPLVSSSLPAARLHDVNATTSTQSIPSTFFKRGLSVTLIPDPRSRAWSPPDAHDTPLLLKSDPRIDFSKLVHLIEDSFGRPLDVEHYLNRIESRIAGVIIAGDYEGGAILTWEQPPGRPGRPPVPYLDKFAVLRRSQGSGGVADIVFNAMVQTCFPHGVVWRSRRENPVNKWYFERASGTWKVPETIWTMFWTGNGVDSPPSTTRNANEAEERWRDYVSVCANVQASWADLKPPD